jgi:hypothetical protein
MLSLADILQTTTDELVQLLSSSAATRGFSISDTPLDLQLKVQRTSSCYVLCTAGSDSYNSKLQITQGGARSSLVGISCNLMLVGYEIKGPRGVLALAAAIETALSGSKYCLASQLEYTSYKDSLWQYRMQLEIQVPRTSRL